MLTLPDLKEKQLLFIHSRGEVPTGIKLQNENIVFTKNDKVINRVSCHKVFNVFVIGDLTITSRLIREGNRYGISFFFLKDNFETYASINAAAAGNYLLRMKQYDLLPEKELKISKAFVKSKAGNQFTLLKSRDKMGSFQKAMREISSRIDHAQDNQTLLGIEGEFSRNFFGHYFKKIDWRRRMPRIKPDVPNFLLDMGYTFLFNFVDSMLLLHGFDTYKGVYHKLFFQRKSLSCDLVEPFRCIIDKQVLKSYNLKQVDMNDFTVMNGKVALSFDKNQKYALIFTQTIMDYKEEIFSYVHDFYRFLMRDSNPFPEFHIKIK